MIYPRYHCTVKFYRKCKELGIFGTYHLYGTISQLDHDIHKIKRDLRAGWWAIQKMELDTCLLDYENKEDYK